MHKYIVDKEAPSRLKVGHPIIILYEDEASITKYLTFISSAKSCSPKVILKVIYTFTSTYSPDNHTNDPIKRFKSYWSKRSLSNASQYSMSQNSLGQQEIS